MASEQRPARPLWTVVGVLTSIVVAAGALVAVMQMRHDAAPDQHAPVVRTGNMWGGASAMGYMQHPDGAMPMAGMQMPDFSRTSPQLEEMYRSATENGQLMSYMPCVCGCSRMGHLSLWNCFVKSIGPDGTVVFEQHATGCQVCQDLARTVIDMDRRGSPPSEIRRYLDQNFPGEQTPTDQPPVV